jgi:hypothetical protein
MPELQHCILWKDPDATLARPMKDVFALDWQSAHESHFWRYVLRCRACGQRYFFQFLEEIDWDGGLDDQLTLYVPFDDETELERLKTTAPRDLTGVTPRLQIHSPMGSRTKTRNWVTQAGDP